MTFFYYLDANYFEFYWYISLFQPGFFLLTALTVLTGEPHFPCRQKKNLIATSFFFFFHFSYGLICRICISNYKTCTTAAETLQQNTSKGPCTVPRCTAWLPIYFSRSLRQERKAKTNKHLGKRLNLTNKKNKPNLKDCLFWAGADTLLTSVKWRVMRQFNSSYFDNASYA